MEDIAKRLRKRNSSHGDDVPAQEMAAFETAKTKIPDSPNNPNKQPPTFERAIREATAPELVGSRTLSPNTKSRPKTGTRALLPNWLKVICLS